MTGACEDKLSSTAQDVSRPEAGLWGGGPSGTPNLLSETTASTAPHLLLPNYSRICASCVLRRPSSSHSGSAILKHLKPSLPSGSLSVCLTLEQMVTNDLQTEGGDACLSDQLAETRLRWSRPAASWGSAAVCTQLLSGDPEGAGF